MADRQLKVTVVGDTRNLDRALGRTETRLQKFGRNTSALSGGASLSGKGGLGSLGALAKGGGIGLGLGFAGQKALEFTEAASNLNEQLSKSNVIFGESAGAIEAWSKTTATSLGIAQTQALEAAGTFGALFTGTGQSEAEAAKLSQTIVGLAGDLASFSNTSVDDALAALRSGLSGEIEPLRRFQVFLTEASVAQRAMAQSGKASSKELTQGEKILARYSLILEQTSKAQGDFKRTSGSLANQQRVLTAQTDELKTSLGAVLLPALTKVVSGMNEGIKAAKNLGGALDDAGVTGERVGKILKVSFAISPFGEAITGVRLLNKLFGDTKTAVDDVTASAEAFNKAFGVASVLANAPKAPKTAGTPAFGQPGFKTSNTGSQLTREQSLLVQAAKATLNNYLSDDLKVAKALVALYKSLLKGKHGQELFDAQQKLIGAQGAVKGFNDQIAAGAQRVKDAATSATRAAKDAHDKSVKALKAQAAAFKNQADAIKSAVLNAFDSKTSKIDNARALDDAKKALRQAKQLGGTETIKLAGRDLADAQRAIQRQKLEDTLFKVSAGPPGPVNTLQVGSITINVNGVGDPDTVAKKVIAAINRQSKQTNSQSRGHRIGHHIVIA